MIASDLLIVIFFVCVLHYIEQCKIHDFVKIGRIFFIRPQCMCRLSIKYSHSIIRKCNINAALAGKILSSHIS
jgi:hypothetical protein